MMPAGIFDPSVADLVLGTHKVSASLTATTPGQAPVTLSLIGGRVSWAEDRAPRVSATLRCALPDDTSLLQLLDPRLPCRLALTITYTLPNGATSSAVVADLGLRSRLVTRPSAELVLEAASDEALVIDESLPTLYTGTGTYVDAIADGPGWLATLISEPLATGVPPRTVDRSAAPAAAIAWDQNYANTWDAIIDAADQLNLDVFDPGDRVFRIAPRPTVAGTSAFTITSGATGTLLDSGSTIARDNWANYVLVGYEWQDSTGATQKLWGSARVSAGPYAVNTVGYKVLYEDRTGAATTQAAADKVAASILAKLLSRSRTLTATTVAAWWVRPGDTVTVDLPLSAATKHLVSWVDYDIERMTMTVGTRLPDTASTIGE